MKITFFDLRLNILNEKVDKFVFLVRTSNKKPNFIIMMVKKLKIIKKI